MRISCCAEFPGRVLVATAAKLQNYSNPKHIYVVTGVLQTMRITITWLFTGTGTCQHPPPLAHACATKSPK
jgi:hypothetical protein